MSPVVLIPTVITASDVEAAAINTLRPRLAVYMPAVGVAPPRSYVRTASFTKWPEDQLPAVIVICPGVADQPRQAGDKTYIAKWTVGVAAIISAATEAQGEEAARMYGAMIRATMLQQASLGGFARGVTWLDEVYDQLDVDRRRTLQTAEVIFEVEVANVVNARELPLIPEDDPPDPTPSDYTVETVDVEISPVEEVSH